MATTTSTILGDGGKSDSDTRIDENCLAKGWVVIKSSCLGSNGTRARVVGTKVIERRIGGRYPGLLVYARGTGSSESIRVGQKVGG